MLCGTPPFPDGTVLQKLLQHQEDVPPDLRSHRDDLVPEIRSLVRTMLAKSPDDRFQTPADLISTLVAVAEQANIPLSRPAASSPLWIGAPVDSPVRRHLPWIIPTAILVFCVFMFDAIGRRHEMRMGNSEPRRTSVGVANGTSGPQLPKLAETIEPVGTTYGSTKRRCDSPTAAEPPQRQVKRICRRGNGGGKAGDSSPPAAWRS